MYGTKKYLFSLSNCLIYGRIVFYLKIQKSVKKMRWQLYSGINITI